MTLPFSLALRMRTLKCMMTTSCARTLILAGSMRVLLLDCKNRTFLLMKSLFQPLLTFSKGWLRCDVTFSDDQLNFSSHSHIGRVAFTQQLYWFCALLKDTTVKDVCKCKAGFTSTDFIIRSKMWKSYILMWDQLFKPSGYQWPIKAEDH